MLEAAAQFQREPTGNGPRVAAICARERHVVLRYGWIVVELDLRWGPDLSRGAAGEDQAILAGRSAVAVSLNERIRRVLEPRLEFMVSYEQIGLEVGDGGLRRVPPDVIPAAAVGALAILPLGREIES